jgi:hypothetical protein
MEGLENADPCISDGYPLAARCRSGGDWRTMELGSSRSRPRPPGIAAIPVLPHLCQFSEIAVGQTDVRKHGFVVF